MFHLWNCGLKWVKLMSKDPDYMTPSVKAKLKTKNKLMRHGRVEEANQLAIRIGHDIAKRNSTRLKHLNSKTASKDMWGAVRQLTNRDHAVCIPDGVNAEVLNRHYAATSTDANYLSPLVKSTVQGREIPFTVWEVFSRLDKLKATATGLDGLPAWYLRLGAAFFSEPFTKILNRSMTESWVPTQWKRAYIRPIQKVKVPTGPSDFRPISITPVLSRLVEKMVVQKYFYAAFEIPPPQLTMQDQFTFKPEVAQQQQHSYHCYTPSVNYSWQIHIWSSSRSTSLKRSTRWDTTPSLRKWPNSTCQTAYIIGLYLSSMATLTRRSLQTRNRKIRRHISQHHPGIKHRPRFVRRRCLRSPPHQLRKPHVQIRRWCWLSHSSQQHRQPGPRIEQCRGMGGKQQSLSQPQKDFRDGLHQTKGTSQGNAFNTAGHRVSSLPWRSSESRSPKTSQWSTTYRNA